MNRENVDSDTLSTDSNETAESLVPDEQNPLDLDDNLALQVPTEDPGPEVSAGEILELPSEGAHNFDLTLPTAHSYLGNNLEELQGRTLLDDGVYVNLPLLVQDYVVLFPGQTLPMTVFGVQVIEMLEKCISKNRTFGIMCPQQEGAVQIGTTAEIYEYMFDSPERGYRIKAKGRQRFHLLSVRQVYGEVLATVKIVPEVVLPYPLYEHRLTSLDRQRMDPKQIDNVEDGRKMHKIGRVESNLTCWPSWVYKQYDPVRLANKIRQNLQFIETRGSYIPTDPSDLSFWVAQNLPLNDKQRIMLLKFDCAISRLRWELKYLTKDRILVCSSCDKEIGKQLDIFPMSKEGPQNTFCNPGGFIHDTVTLYKAENLQLYRDPPSADFSWFPGYCWTIAICEGCKKHMGWRFTAEDNKSLRPQAFWGLTRKSLRSVKASSSSKDRKTQIPISSSDDDDDVEADDRDDEDDDDDGFLAML